MSYSVSFHFTTDDFFTGAKEKAEFPALKSWEVRPQMILYLIQSHWSPWELFILISVGFPQSSQSTFKDNGLGIVYPFIASSFEAYL